MELRSHLFQYPDVIDQFHVRFGSVTKKKKRKKQKEKKRKGKETPNQWQKYDTHLTLPGDLSPSCRCSVRRGWVCHFLNLTGGWDSFLVVVDQRKAHSCFPRWQHCWHWQFPPLRQCSILPHCQSSCFLGGRSSLRCSLVCWSDRIFG